MPKEKPSPVTLDSFIIVYTVDQNTRGRREKRKFRIVVQNGNILEMSRLSIDDTSLFSRLSTNVVSVESEEAFARYIISKINQLFQVLGRLVDGCNGALSRLNLAREVFKWKNAYQALDQCYPFNEIINGINKIERYNDEE